MKRILFITLILVLGWQQGQAQVEPDKARNGSIYSKLGVGMPIDLASPSADAMGALGVSFFEPNVPGLANPAEWGSTVFSVATGGFALQKFNATDFAGSSSNAVFSANNFQLQLPIQKNKLGISVSIAPLTRSNYRLIDSQTRFTSTDTLTAFVQSQGDGGINNLELGVGWKINRYISVGYAASLILASLDNEITTEFAERNDFQNVEYTIQTSGTGMGNRIGTMITIPRPLGAQDQLRLGAAVELPVVVNTERIQRSQKQLGSGRTETVVVREGEGLGDGDLSLPLKVSGGLTYQVIPRFSISAEGLYQEWSAYENSFNPAQQNFLADRYKGAFGIRYFPFISGSNKFLSKFKYRAGVSYDTGHLKIDGRQIETLLFSAGLGIPSPNPNSNSSIDIGFHYGIRGTEAQNLVRESIWGIRLSINLAELMFFRPKLQ